MSYESWHANHANKHKKIINKLSHLSPDEIIEYFRFENMVQNEPDFCPLYEDNIKCHDMEYLNCYFCGCPNFRIGQEKSYCSINSKYGGTMEGPDGYIHLDCSKCLVPHRKKYIKKNFDLDWSKVMSENIQR